MDSRRAFLGKLLGLTAAATVWPEIVLEAQRGPKATTPAEYEGKLWDRSFQAVHKQAYALFCQEMGVRGYPVDPFHVTPHKTLGETVEDGIVLAHQCSVMSNQPDLASGYDGLIPPAIHALVLKCVEQKLTHWGTLPLPTSVGHASNIGPLRLVGVYDLENDDYLVRFDVLGGRA